MADSNTDLIEPSFYKTKYFIRFHSNNKNQILELLVCAFFLPTPNTPFGIEESFLACVGLGMVINSLGDGGCTLSLFCLSLVLRSMEREEEGLGGGGVESEGKRETGRQSLRGRQ